MGAVGAEVPMLVKALTFLASFPLIMQCHAEITSFESKQPWYQFLKEASELPYCRYYKTHCIGF